MLVGGGGGGLPAQGTRSTIPTKIKFGLAMPLTTANEVVVVPKRRAMRKRVSPGRTTYVEAGNAERIIPTTANATRIGLNENEPFMLTSFVNEIGIIA